MFLSLAIFFLTFNPPYSRTLIKNQVSYLNDSILNLPKKFKIRSCLYIIIISNDCAVITYCEPLQQLEPL